MTEYKNGIFGLHGNGFSWLLRIHACGPPENGSPGQHTAEAAKIQEAVTATPS